MAYSIILVLHEQYANVEAQNIILYKNIKLKIINELKQIS